jgi:hypothetical protein
MRTVLQALRELLDPRILLQDGALELRELDPASTCPSTKLDRSGRSVALRFEPWSYKPSLQIPTNRWLFPLFDITRSGAPICRSCDYIIFYAPADETQRIFVFMCELKSGSPRGSLSQIRNGTLLARYILEVVKLHGAVHQWPVDVQFRGLVFAGNAPSLRGGLRASDPPRYEKDQLEGLYTLVGRPGGRHHLQTFCS